MTVVVDLNVVLDVFQNRQPHFAASAQVLSLICEGRIRAIFPAHCLTTLYYIVAKHGVRGDAAVAVDKVLEHFEIASLDQSGWRTARGLPMNDFEDAAVASIAAESHADFIITRNEADFANGGVAAISPAHFLGIFPPIF